MTNANTNRRAPRYSITTDFSGSVLMTINAECWLGDAGSTREFRSCGGYVYEIFEGGERRTQVCDRLEHGGSTLTASEEGLAAAIRHEARACLRAEAKDDARWA